MSESVDVDQRKKKRMHLTVQAEFTFLSNLLYEWHSLKI